MKRPSTATTLPDRRARRRQETIDEILTIAQEVMAEEGVNGLSLAEVARRLGVQPPSIYKYFPSLMAVYDELFRAGPDREPRGDAPGHRTRPNRGWQAIDRRLGGQRTLAAGPPRPGPVAVLAPGAQVRTVARGLRAVSRDGGHPAGPTGQRGGQGGGRSRGRFRRSDLPHLDADHRGGSPRPWPTSPIWPGARADSPRCSPG